jgi:methyl-accepting chemotaxis protein
VLAGVLLYPLVTEFQEPGREGAARNEKANALLFLHDRVWLIFGLGILAVLLLSLRSSHRIAGALCRFRGVFGRVAAGSIPASIRIRRDDYIHREEDALNRALDRLHAGIGEIEEAREGLDRLAGDLEGDRRRRLDEDLARLERGLAQLRRERHGQG